MRRWPKKREFLAYYLLYRSFGCSRALNLGELLDRLEPYFGKKVSVSLIRRLTHLGFLYRKNAVDYRVACLEEVLDRYLDAYLEARKRRRGAYSSS